jgi:hypothetical protein
MSLHRGDHRGLEIELHPPHFLGLGAGDDTVSGVSRTGIPMQLTRISYSTAKTILGARAAAKGKDAA